MQVNKNDFIGHLKTPLYELCEVSVRMPRRASLCIPIVSGHEVMRLLREQPMKRGIPECASYDKGQYSISVFPRTNRRYRFRVIGTQFIEQ